jgi:hypothetical protein
VIHRRWSVRSLVSVEVHSQMCPCRHRLYDASHQLFLQSGCEETRQHPVDT